jgi:hypothetical protein
VKPASKSDGTELKHFMTISVMTISVMTLLKLQKRQRDFSRILLVPNQAVFQFRFMDAAKQEACPSCLLTKTRQQGFDAIKPLMPCV